MFEFNVRLDDEDYLDYYTYHVMQSGNLKRVLFLSFVAAPLAGLLIATWDYLLAADMQIFLFDGVFIAIIVILWILFHEKFIIWGNRRQINKLNKAGKLPYIKDSIIRFTEENVQVISSAVESKTDYSVLEKLAVTDRAVFVYFGATQAFTVPTVSFRDEEEKQRFIRFLQSKIRS